MSERLPLNTSNLPPPPPLRKLIGPSFIILGLGLGSGEIILWPYLTSNFGLGLVWAIVIGVTMQFFINMEVERYALINGESIFVGFARWLKYLPLWFIVSTFLGFGWPGIGLAGATLLSRIVPGSSPQIVAIVTFAAIGLILTLGKVLYQTVESLQKYLILLGTPVILMLTLYLSKPTHLQALADGLIGRGEGFNFLPAAIPLATFLAALAYSGAGGNLNLTQSNYIRDKGYGMGVFADKIKSLITTRSSSPIRLAGTTFPLTKENLINFKNWWRLINLEHFLIFWVLGLITMLTLSLLSYITTFGHPGNVEGINFVLQEAAYIGQQTAPLLSTLFLLVTGLMLTATQLTVLDSTSRIIAENSLLLRGSQTASSKSYYVTLWVQIIFGLVVIFLGFQQPRHLITLGAVINAFSMFVYILLLLRLNNSRLASPLRPHLVRNLVLIFSSLFFGSLFLLTVFPK